MDIERRRQMYNSTRHLQAFPPVTQTPEPDATQKNWNTSLSPRTPALTFGAAIEANRRSAQGCHQQGFKSEEEESGSSSRLSRQLPISSPGHQIHPATEPGPLYGVRPPKFTHRHAHYDVPFYGIENVEISSSRYELLTQSNSIKDLGVLNDPLQAVGVSGGGRRSGGNGAGDGSGRASLLSKHREHIWSIAHEEEYGSAEMTGVAEGDVDIELLRGRFKRTQRMLPIVQLPPVAAAGSTSGSGSGSAELQRQGARGKSWSETTSRARGRKATDTRIEIDNDSQFEMTNMETVSSLATLSTTTSSNSNNGVLLLATDRRRHGHGHGHGYGHRRSSRPPRLPRPISQGVYGPDSFQESLDNLKEGPERPTGSIKRSLAIVSRHWKTWLCVGMLLAVAIVIPLMLKKKGSSGDGKLIASVGHDSEHGGDELEDRKTTTAKESSGGGGRTIVTKTTTPFPSSTKGVKTSLISTSTSSSLSSETRTPKATVRQSLTARTPSRRRFKAVTIATTSSSSGNVAPTSRATSLSAPV
ncbi:hypothetical protein BGZ95_000657 [Linnemannia exigua]|uniref:Uncharacterized protein n=1 Tax=Linnemannia exigua TaxID=604196 RepID=A0AAD4DA26_9FUNG|nr:hypothetical protein BGZ95_000657 [Linnemannia exigua]